MLRFNMKYLLHLILILFFNDLKADPKALYEIINSQLGKNKKNCDIFINDSTINLYENQEDLMKIKRSLTLYVDTNLFNFALSIKLKLDSNLLDKRYKIVSAPPSSSIFIEKRYKINRKGKKILKSERVTYPKCYTYDNYSNPLFSSDGKYLIIEISSSSGVTRGYRSIFLYQKEKSGWVKKHTLVSYIS